MKLNIKELNAGKTFLESYPTHFNVDIYGFCNLAPACVMCPKSLNGKETWEHKGLAPADIESFGNYAKLAERIDNCSIGEPFMHRNIIKIIEIFHSWEKNLWLATHGLLLGPRIIDQLTPYLDLLSVLFSVDGATSETYSKIRSAPFNKVLKNISAFTKKRLDAFPEGTQYASGICFILMNMNKHEIPKIIRLTAELGLDGVALRPLTVPRYNYQIELGNHLFNYHDEMVSPEELAEIGQQAAELANKYGIFLWPQFPIDTETVFKQEVKVNVKCPEPWRFLLPYQNGHTVACCYMLESLGNWRKEGLDSLWNSERLQTMRRQSAEGQLPAECWNYPSCPLVKGEIQSHDVAGINSRKSGTTDFDLSLIGTGWYGIERDENDEWLWCGKTPGVILVPKNVSRCDLIIESPMYYFFKKPLKVIISSNAGKTLKEVELFDGKTKINLNIEDVLQFQIEPTSSWIPKETIQSSKDNRYLSFRLLSLKLSHKD